MQKILTIIFVSIFLFLDAECFPQTYYVAKNGDDYNPGTQAEPWATIQKEADVMVPGDTVLIKAGVYNERVFPKRSGQPGQFITYKNFENDEVIIDGDNQKANGIILVDMTYIAIKGFTFINFTNSGIRIERSDNNIISNYKGYNNSHNGIWIFQNSDNNLLDRDICSNNILNGI